MKSAPRTPFGRGQIFKISIARRSNRVHAEAQLILHSDDRVDD
jgi:hypothetical protein